MPKHMSEKPTILQVSSTWLHPTQTWLWNTLRHLPGSINSIVACRHSKHLDRFPIAPLHILESEKWPQKLLWQLTATLTGKNVFRYTYLKHIIQTQNIHLIHSHFADSALKDMAISKQTNCPQIVTFYGYDVNELPKKKPEIVPQYQALFKHIGAVLCEGPHMAKCIEALGCPKDKVHLQKIGIPLEDFPFNPRKRAPNDPLKILMAASFREKKGLPIAIDALGKIKDTIPFKATLIGDGDNEEKQKIAQKIAQYGLENHINQHGYLPYDTLKTMAQDHDIFLSPSIEAKSGDTEGGAPIALLEMAALGLIIVSTTHCDIPHIFKHTETALLSPENDSTHLSQSLTTLYKMPKIWPAIREKARNMVEIQHSVQTQAQKLEKIYKSLLGNL